MPAKITGYTVFGFAACMNSLLCVICRVCYCEVAMATSVETFYQHHICLDT